MSDLGRSVNAAFYVDRIWNNRRYCYRWFCLDDGSEKVEAKGASRLRSMHSPFYGDRGTLNYIRGDIILFRLRRYVSEFPNDTGREIARLLLRSW